MKAEFLRWCEEVSLSVDSTDVDARFAAVEAAAMLVTHEELEALKIGRAHV